MGNKQVKIVFLFVKCCFTKLILFLFQHFYFVICCAKYILFLLYFPLFIKVLGNIKSPAMIMLALFLLLSKMKKHSPFLRLLAPFKKALSKS